MQTATNQSYKLTFNPACLSLNAQEVLKQLRANKEFEISPMQDECPYDPAFMDKLQRISKGKFTQHSIEELFA